MTNLLFKFTGTKDNKRMIRFEDVKDMVKPGKPAPKPVPKPTRPAKKPKK
jgi:hypothetical protein